MEYKIFCNTSSFLFIDLQHIKSYIDSFKYGTPPHAGGGIGEYFIISIYRVLLT